MPFADVCALLELIHEDTDERRDFEASLHGAERKAATPEQAAELGRETTLMARARERERQLQARLSGRRR
jgi:hypothetical protein